MDLRQVEDIISSGENQKVEFKESFHSSQDISKIICGFANTEGGVLLLGVDDNGGIVGFGGGPDQLQQQVSCANQNVSPQPLMSIEAFKKGGRGILAVIVQRPSDSVYYTFNGAIYVRVGSTNRRLEGQTHLEFLRNKQVLSFDNLEDPDFKIGDISKEHLRRYLSLRGMDDYLLSNNIEQYLVSNKLVSQSGLIKNPAILFFANDPARYIPQCVIELVKFGGDEPVDILSHRSVKEDLISAKDAVIDFIKEHIDKRIDIKGEGRRNEIFEYPMEVIREAIVNAMTHRDYFRYEGIQVSIFNNRLEITNPGSIPKGLSKELFGTISVQRNPVVYRLMKDIGLVEGLGTGIPRMKSAMRTAGLPEPEFTITESFFRITLFSKAVSAKAENKTQLNDRQLKAMAQIRKNGSINSSQYSKLTGVSVTTSVKDLNQMIGAGLIKKKGRYRNAFYVLKGDSEQN